MPDNYQKGMQVRRSVLGDSYVDRAEAAKTNFDKAFQRLITESAWGTVWADDTISQRERSMLTLALLAATGNFEEMPMHILRERYPMKASSLEAPWLLAKKVLLHRRK